MNIDLVLELIGTFVAVFVGLSIIDWLLYKLASWWLNQGHHR
jgi:hypothetical protein